MGSGFGRLFLIVLTPVPVWHILVLFSNREESKKGSVGSVESQLLYPKVRIFLRPNKSDARDSEPDYLLRPTRHGRDGTLRDY